ncbi:MAG: hypothetical protein J6P46_03685, partial [Bacteroidales bacterium]|nr:hypothetical protein [Bacteroidales bacterium]
GDSSITEVPVSSFGLPYIGTLLRISPTLTALTRDLLYLETKRTDKGINFLIHPNELIVEENLHMKTERRAGNYVSYLLSDVLRRKLKQKNLGPKATVLFRREVAFWANKEYEFKRIKDYGTE